MNACQIHVMPVPTVLTPKGPFFANAILGILEMASIVPTLMNACLTHVMQMPTALTPKVP